MTNRFPLPAFVVPALSLLFLLGSSASELHSQETTNALDQQISEEELTPILPPAGDGKFGLYQVWIPSGYYEAENEKRTYPVMIIDNAGGNSHSRFRVVQEWVRDNKWICVMPTTVSNESKHNQQHYAAIFPDIKQRFRLTPRAGIMTGHSGGSRRSTHYGNLNRDIIGGIISNGGISSGGAPQCKNPQMMSATLMGLGDFNIPELRYAAPHLDPARVRARMFNGHHQWGPKDLQIETLDWMATELLSRFGQPEPVKQLMESTQAKLEIADSDIVRVELMNRYVLLYKSQRLLKKNDELKKTATQYKAELKKLSRDKAVLTEMKAMEALQQIRDQHARNMAEALKWSLGSLTPPKKHGAQVVQTTANTQRMAMDGFNKLKESFPDSMAARLADEDIAGLNAFKKLWKQ